MREAVCVYGGEGQRVCGNSVPSSPLNFAVNLKLL